ncbi:MAG: RDD family protein, partial [Sphingobacteriales bacterium]
VIPVFFGYFYSFLNKKNQCWHDISANTLVIKDRLI